MATRRSYGRQPQRSRLRAAPAAQRPVEAPRPPPRPTKQVPPPFPTFLVGAIGFAVLSLLSIVLNYYSPSYPFLVYVAYLLFFLALVLVVYSLYAAVAFHGKHRTEFPQRCKVSAIATVVILMGGTIACAVTFVMLEPYHDWSYSADLGCPGNCVADLPVPMRAPDSNRTFFNESEISSKGQGFFEVMQQYYNGHTIPVLRVHWAGNLTLKASASKDYRDLPMGRNGLFNSTRDKFIVVGLTVPSGKNFTVRIELSHDRVSQTPDSDHWVVQGKVGPGQNALTPERP